MTNQNTDSPTASPDPKPPTATQQDAERRQGARGRAVRIISGLLMGAGLFFGWVWGSEIYENAQAITQQIAGFTAFLSVAIGAYIFGRALENIAS